MSDAELLRSYVLGKSDEAFQTLVGRHLDMVYATALRQLRNSALAEEAAQNVFIALARKAPLLCGRNDLSGWLYKAALLKARERIREEVRRAKREEIAATLGTTMKEEDSLLQSMCGVLDDALIDLREKERQALILRFFENKSLRDVGKALGISEDAAQKRVASALDVLGGAFRKRGYKVAGTAATVSVLTHATQAAPAVAAGVVSRAAVQYAATASLTSFGLITAKLMTLTKTQTAIVCVALSAAPIAYEWKSISNARAENESARMELTLAGKDVAATDRDLLQLERRWQATRDTNARLEADLERRHAAGPAQFVAAEDAAPYRWSDDSEYVRLPKSILRKVVFAPEDDLPPQSDGGNDPRFELPRTVLGEDGRISELFLEALGLSSEEDAALETAVSEFIDEYYAVAARHSVLTNTPPGVHGFSKEDDSLTLITAAFPEEGAALKEAFEARLEHVLGRERAGLFLAQVKEDTRLHFAGFGAAEKLVTVVHHKSAQLPFTVLTNVRGRWENRASRSARLTGPQLPPHLKTWWPEHLVNLHASEEQE